MNEVIENQEIFGKFDNGGALLRDLHVRGCSFFHCGLSITHDPDKRSHVQRVIIEDCNLRSCSIGSAIVEDSVIRSVRSKSLIRAEGAVFKHVTFEGEFNEIGLIPAMPLLSETMHDVAAMRAASSAFYQHVDWAIDIRGANFRCFDIAGIPARLIRRDPKTSCVIRREKVVDGRWRNLDLRNTHWPVAIGDLLESEDEDSVLVAGRRDRDFRALVAGIELLRQSGIAEPD